MENLSLSTSSVNDSVVNSTESEPFLIEPLPIGAVAFVPVIFLELVAAVVSSALLLALVILACVHKLNNINIYLASLCINGFVGAFSILFLLMLVIARRWVFGYFMCAANFSTLIISNTVYLVLYVIISRDKYIIVRHSFLSRPSKGRAYLLSIVAWTVSIVFGTLITFRAFNHIPNPGG